MDNLLTVSDFSHTLSPSSRSLALTPLIGNCMDITLLTKQKEDRYRAQKHFLKKDEVQCRGM